MWVTGGQQEAPGPPLFQGEGRDLGCELQPKISPIISQLWDKPTSGNTTPDLGNDLELHKSAYLSN